MQKDKSTLPYASATDATILDIRLECKSEEATRGVIEILEGALGAASEVSRPYPNRDSQSKRIYIRFVVPSGSN